LQRGMGDCSSSDKGDPLENDLDRIAAQPRVSEEVPPLDPRNNSPIITLFVENRGRKIKVSVPQAQTVLHLKQLMASQLDILPEDAASLDIQFCDSSLPAAASLWDNGLRDQADVVLGGMENAVDFFEAVRQGDLNTCKFVCDQASHRLKSVNKFGRTAVHEAAMRGQAQVLVLLLEPGTADLNATADSGETPLHFVAYCVDTAKSTQMTQLLIAAGANLNARSETQRTPCHVAAVNGQDGSLACLVDAGAATDCLDTNGESILSLGIRYPSDRFSREQHHSAAGRIAETLVAADAEWCLPLLCEAVWQNQESVVRVLLGVLLDDALVVDAGGNTPLHKVSRSSLTVLNLLLDAFPDWVNTVNNANHTPLYSLLSNWQRDNLANDVCADAQAVLVQTMLNAGCEWRAAGSALHHVLTGATALVLVNHFDQPYAPRPPISELDLIIPNSGSYRKDGGTPLHSAAAAGLDDVVEVLIGAGANKEALNEDQMTPLQLAEENQPDSWRSEKEKEERFARVIMWLCSDTSCDESDESDHL